MDENVLTNMEPTYLMVDDVMHEIDENEVIQEGDNFILIRHPDQHNEVRSVCKMIDWNHDQREGTFLAYDYAKDCNFTSGVRTMYKIIKYIV